MCHGCVCSLSVGASERECAVIVTFATGRPKPTQPNPDGRSVSRARDSAYVLLLLFHLVTGCRSSILVRARRTRCSYKYRRHSINCTIRESSRQDHLMHQLATTTTAAARVCLMSRKNTNSQLLVNSNARFPLDMRTECMRVCMSRLFSFHPWFSLDRRFTVSSHLCCRIGEATKR